MKTLKLNPIEYQVDRITNWTNEEGERKRVDQKGSKKGCINYINKVEQVGRLI